MEIGFMKKIGNVRKILGNIVITDDFPVNLVSEK